jgi:hypothetical protein
VLPSSSGTDSASRIYRMGRLLAVLSAFSFVLAACTQAATGANPTLSPTSSPEPTPSARASASAATTARASASTKPIDLQVVVPEKDANAGIDGISWTVDIIAKGTSPALEKIKPGIRGGGSTGRNPNFPGLVVMLKPASQGGALVNPSTNLAGLFQIIGLPNTLGPIAGVSSVNAIPSTSKASAATSTSSADGQTAEATWFVQHAMWGSDVDVELTAFVVDGDAPDTVSDRSSLKIVSNEVTVSFHINGGATP